MAWYWWTLIVIGSLFAIYGLAKIGLLEVLGDIGDAIGDIFSDIGGHH